LNIPDYPIPLGTDIAFPTGLATWVVLTRHGKLRLLGKGML
jgi:hypothetical protein